jgi:hypothetical protein
MVVSQLKSDEETLAGKRQAVDEILRHPLFHGAEALSALLRYLAERTLNGASEPLKEHQIATELFGKAADFDPRTDSSVRVHISRLRAKLTDYYRATSDVAHTWLIELPKGGHLLKFSSPVTLLVNTAEPLPLSSKPGVAVRVWAGVFAGVLLAFAAGWYLKPGPPMVPSSSKKFWDLALRSPNPPLVIFSNAEFVGRPEVGLRYLRPGEQASGLLDTYTGIGEVFAVDAIHGALARLGRSYELRRSQQLSWDEAKSRDLVFIGSPSENLPVRQMSLQKSFAFQVSSGPVRPGDLALVNINPRQGEQKQYFATPKPPITEDYAIVEVSSGANPSQCAVLLAGTTTYGTEAAAEFVANPESLAQLWSRLPDRAKPNHVVALLHVDVKGGVPVESTIVAVRSE